MGMLTTCSRGEFEKTYINMEVFLGRFCLTIASPFCSVCDSVCCREEHCRDSLESRFLQDIQQAKDNVRYDRKNGWLTQNGCGLLTGRPLLCYEFFCHQMAGSREAARIKAMIRDIKQILRMSGKNGWRLHETPGKVAPAVYRKMNLELLALYQTSSRCFAGKMVA